jgi:hypothetical protein
LALAAGSPSAMGEGRTLQHDPFARPALGALPAAAVPGAPARRVQGAPPEAKPKISLHAVLVAGPDSMANIDGVMVRLGESVQGYRLLAVHDRSAVFEKNNAKFTLGIGATPRIPAPGGAK